MRVRKFTVIALSVFSPLAARGGVIVEQIEAPIGPTQYAPVEFGGHSTIAGTGDFAGITFHAVDGTIGTLSGHAATVGENMYGPSGGGNGFISDVYVSNANSFLDNIIDGFAQTSVAGPLPGNFVTGAQVINNSYVGAVPSNDFQRRIDYMIDRSDVVFVAAAANTGTLAGNNLVWSSYNSLAVTGAQGFDPSTSTGKPHADLGLPSFYGTEVSYVAGQVSGDAAGLFGSAQNAAQADAQHSPVIRSLLMTGAIKSNYVRGTANNLDLVLGAGQPSFSNSLAVLQGGEGLIQSVSGGASAGSLSTSLSGWTYGPVSSNSQSVVMFHTSSPITGITASLNWDVTSATTYSSVTHTTTIDTTDNGMIFPNLGLELRPVTFSNGQYVIGPSYNDPTLQSSVANDNVQYLYSSKSLPAGNYAFVITGDPTRSPTVGFSYLVNSTGTSDLWKLSTGGSWGASTNWTNGIPNGPGAQANFMAIPTGLANSGSITLSANPTVGEITFSDTNSYSIDPGTGGTLTINDAGDPGGAYPSINVIAGNQSITAPVSLANGVTITTTPGSGLNLSANLTGVGGLIAAGKGSVTLGGLDNYGNTTVSGGTLNVNGAILSSNVTVANGATLNVPGSLSPSVALTTNGNVILAANTGTTVVSRTLGSLAIGTSGLVTLSPAASNSSRTVLITGPLSISTGGRLDLTNNDLIVKNTALASVLPLVQSGLNFSAHGYWNGTTGIISTKAASNTTYLTTLAVVQNDDGHGNPVFGTGTIAGPFDGQNPGAGDVLVKYTFYGDADLNGALNGADYTKIDTGFAMHRTGWFNGDFNYDGIVDGTDFALIDNAYNQQVANPTAFTLALIAPSIELNPSSLTATVPEPGALGLFATALVAGIFTHRRRRSIA